jgi:exopolysaccharide biosynthesis WecB/TagA/CpsF family protein/anti-anti-sigma factor
MEEASKQNKSVFFLGGKGTAGKKASEKLKSVNPNLIVAGVSSPFVYVEGEAMLEEEDFSLLEEINNSKADILLIAFGNPKQEIWFERNRHRLSVPVSIGIGGTFEFITGSVARAPLWMQKAGLEWIFRILQDPKRLWKRYFTGFFKFGVMALPAILNSFARTRETTVRVVMLSEKERFTVSNLKCGELTSIWRKALQEGINKQESAFFIAGVSRSVEKYLKANKIWDIFKGRICETVEEAVKKLEENIKRASFYYFVKEEENHFVVSFFGRLDSARVLELDFEEFMNKLTAKNTDCILDLSELNFVDSSGLGFLVKIYKRLTKENQNCFLCSVNENVSQLLRITKLNNVIKIFPDVASAIKK